MPEAVPAASPPVEPAPAVRLAHFSDIHVTARRLGWNRRDLFTKRVTGWMNLKLLGRGFRFRRAAAVAATLTRELHQRRPDHLLFSGDATALGFESELAEAAKALTVGDPALPPALAVPGNHDYYVRSAVRQGLFERYFAPWQLGRRLDERHVYPFAQQAGPVWLIGVCSSTCNFWTWDASGAVGPDQRERLRLLLRELPPGPRVLVTHYPVSLADGRPERRSHALRDYREVVRVAADGGVGLWVHGHRHHPYHRPVSPENPFPLVCAGSATQSNLWTYNEYAVTDRHVLVLRRRYSPLEGQFRDAETFELEMPG
jgi:3',5'-cyclic AMP phosphodiesterase CpdA